ncbi:MAG TPA: CapA family protein [Beijerinckiaceae bacterium]|nr:CapA family protein [Beijerinckiaceae bacterium]
MLYESESGDLDISLAGDVMLTRRISVAREPAFTAIRDIIRDSDVAFANLESSVRTPDEGTPGITVGTYMTTPPDLLDEIKWLGIGLVSCANNHAFDYGEGGVLATMQHLDEAGIAHAGSGRNLAEARAPAYIDTPRGRVALIATTATFRPWNRASGQRSDMGGRPGINPFGSTSEYVVDTVAIAELRRINTELGFEKARSRDLAHFYSERDLGGKSEEAVVMLGHRFVGGDEFSVRSKGDVADAEDNLRWIAEARRQADWVIMSFHSHEFGGKSTTLAESRADLEEPADFVKDFGRAAIDAGADMFVGHGSHTLLGAEIYRKKPIFYSLGNLVFMNETVPAFPEEAYLRFDLGPNATPADFLDVRTDKDKKGHPANAKYWQGAVAKCRYRKRELVEIRLYPTDLGFGTGRAQRGRPMLATGEVADRIISRAQNLSSQYGTHIMNDNGVGVIRA